MGSSFGGLASIITASKTKDLFVLALRAPVSNYEERDIMKKTQKELDDWKNNGFMYHERQDGKKLKINYTFFEDFKNNNGYEAAKKIKIPTLIVHGDKDESVPVEQSKKTAKLIKNCKLEIIKGANHNFTEHFEQCVNLISEFIIKKSKNLL